MFKFGHVPELSHVNNFPSSFSMEKNPQERKAGEETEYT